MTSPSNRTSLSQKITHICLKLALFCKVFFFLSHSLFFRKRENLGKKWTKTAIKKKRKEKLHLYLAFFKTKTGKKTKKWHFVLMFFTILLRQTCFFFFFCLIHIGFVICENLKNVYIFPQKYIILNVHFYLMICT